MGSGLGGPSRYFAQERGWRVDGIDLTPEYVALNADYTMAMKVSDS